jgi:acetyl-CoA carboxylase carboxyl transferase subunit beta
MSGKVLHAFEYARSQKLPVVLLVAGGVASVPAGPLSLAQGSRLATAAAQLHLDGVPVLGVLTHPMSSGVYAALAAHCDVLLSEPGVVVHARGAGGAPRAEPWTAETLLARGWIDGLVRRDELSSQVGLFLDLVSAVGLVRPDAIVPREAAAFALPDALARLRQEGRPGVAECLAHLVPSAVPLRGDRVNDDHPGVLCGIGRLDGMSIAYAGVTREARALPAGGAAARKIGRIARLAGRFELPLLLLVDGAVGAPEPPFEPDAANAEAALAATLAVLPVPVIAVGLGCMSGSLATLMMNGDRQYLMSSAVCTPPPDNASGWQPGRPASGRVAALTARECERLGLVDGVIAEPPAGAHADPDGMLIALRATVVQALAELAGTGPRRLLDTRVLRQRTLGQSTPEGLAEARSELWALQDWQRTVERNVERSLDEWRGRWEQLKASQPRITFQRPDIADLAARVRARRTELLERAGLGDRSHD